jgi:hypothetical protein
LLHQSEAEGALMRPLRWNLPEMTTEQTLSHPKDRIVRIPTLPQDLMTRTRSSVDKDRRSQRRGPLNALNPVNTLNRSTRRSRGKPYRAKGGRIV